MLEARTPLTSLEGKTIHRIAGPNRKGNYVFLDKDGATLFEVNHAHLFDWQGNFFEDNL